MDNDGVLLVSRCGCRAEGKRVERNLHIITLAKFDKMAYSNMDFVVMLTQSMC